MTSNISRPILLFLWTCFCDACKHKQRELLQFSGNCHPQSDWESFSGLTLLYIWSSSCFSFVQPFLGSLPPWQLLWTSKVVPHCCNSISHHPRLNDGMQLCSSLVRAAWELPQSPHGLLQIPPDDCILLAESLSAFELLKCANCLLSCRPAFHCFLVSLHLLCWFCLSVCVHCLLQHVVEKHNPARELGGVYLEEKKLCALLL